MKIISWNINRGYYLDKVINILKKEEPDILILSEVDRGVERTNYIDVVEGLSLAFPDYDMYWSIEFEEPPSIWRSIVPTGGPGGGVHGNLIMSRYPIKEKETMTLPGNNTLTWDRTTIFPELFEPRRGSRIAQICEIEIPNETILVSGTHLENWRSSSSHRRKQLTNILDAIYEQDKLTIVGGDMNTLGGFARFGARLLHNELTSFRELARDYELYDLFQNNHWTFKLGPVKGKLDWLFTNTPDRVIDTKVGYSKASDHAYLAIEFR